MAYWQRNTKQDPRHRYNSSSFHKPNNHHHNQLYKNKRHQNKNNRYVDVQSPFHLPRIDYAKEYRRGEEYFINALRHNPDNFVLRHIYTRWLMTRREAIKSIKQSDYLLNMMDSYEINQHKKLNIYELKIKYRLLSDECEAYWESGKQNKKPWNIVIEFISKQVEESKKNSRYFPSRSSQFIHRLYFDSLYRLKPQMAMTEITQYLDQMEGIIEFDTAKLWQLKGFIMDILRYNKQDILQCYDRSWQIYAGYKQQTHRNDPHGWLRCELQFGMMRQICIWRWNVPDAYMNECIKCMQDWWRSSQHVDPGCQIIAADYYYCMYLQTLDDANLYNNKQWLRKANMCLNPTFLPKRKFDKVPQEMTAPHISDELKAYFKKNFVGRYDVIHRNIDLDEMKDIHVDEDKHDVDNNDINNDVDEGKEGQIQENDREEKVQYVPLSEDNLNQLNDANIMKGGEPSVVSSMTLSTNPDNEGRGQWITRNKRPSPPPPPGYQ